MRREYIIMNLEEGNLLIHSRSSSGNMGILLLCDVLAKPYLEMKDASYNAAEEVKAAGKACVLICQTSLL